MLEDLRKNKFEDLSGKLEDYCREYDLNESKSLTNGSIKEQRKRIFGIILDDILKHIKVRFLDFKDLKFISLFDENKLKNLDCEIANDAFDRQRNNF